MRLYVFWSWELNRRRFVTINTVWTHSSLHVSAITHISSKTNNRQKENRAWQNQSRMSMHLDCYAWISFEASIKMLRTLCLTSQGDRRPVSNSSHFGSFSCTQCKWLLQVQKDREIETKWGDWEIWNQRSLIVMAECDCF